MKNFIYNAESAVVQTKRGKVRGYIYDNQLTFKGIPYAVAERWQAPGPVPEWEEVLDCTSYGYVCPLLEIGKPNGELNVPHRYWPMNEDCLNLNVWTPGLDQVRRPVMVWLHGGGYEAGSSIEQLAYEGGSMSKHGDVVVVSVNHRLNILGYFDVSPFGREYANSGNAGGDDIIAALKWVRENIVSFGGDPDNVTVFGQSGGGAKVTTLLQTPAADGLYHKGINMSGVIGPLLADSKGDSTEIVRAMMSELGIKNDDIKALAAVPYDRLAAAYKKLKPEFQRAGKYVGCTPRKNDFYMGDPAENGFREETKDIPMLIGTTFGEFSGFSAPAIDKAAFGKEAAENEVKAAIGEEDANILLPLFEAAYPERSPLDVLTKDFMFRGPQIEYVKQRSALNDCTWVYLFNMDQPINYGTVPWHCADIPFVFHNTSLVPSTAVEGVTETLERQIFGCVMTFARTGDPNNHRIPTWPGSTPEIENTMIFDSDTRVCPNHDAELMVELQRIMGPRFFAMMEAMMSKAQH